MPTSQERVANMPLSGIELKRLLLEDFERLLANEGMLSDYVAYGRVGYRLTIALYIDNPHLPRSSSFIDSKPAGSNDIESNPALAAIEKPPLADPSDAATIGASSISRNVSSPNVERIRTGQPVPVSVRQQDGTTTTEKITYPPDPSADAGDVMIEDATPEARAEWQK